MLAQVFCTSKLTCYSHRCRTGSLRPVTVFSPLSLVWIRIYSSAFSPKRYNWRAGSVERTAESRNLLSVEDKDAGHWKKEYIMKQMASLRAALAQVLKPVNLYTGLPENTKEALRYDVISNAASHRLGLCWPLKKSEV